MCFGDGDSDGWSTTSSEMFKKPRHRSRVWSPDGYPHSPNLPVASSTSSLISASAPRRSSLAARRPSSPPPRPVAQPAPRPRRSVPAIAIATRAAPPNPIPPRPRARPAPRPPPPPYPADEQPPPLSASGAHFGASSFPLPLPPPPFAAPYPTSENDFLSPPPPLRRHSLQSSAPSSPRPQLAHNLPWMSNVDLPSTSNAAASCHRASAGDGGRRRERARAASSADLRVPPAPLAMRPAAARSVANVDRAGGRDAPPARQDDGGIGAQGPSFHERLSARLNDIIDEIDHEVFRGGELVLGTEISPLVARANGP
jgi:hypothetical protein